MKISNSDNVAIVYLLYTPFGVATFKAFLESFSNLKSEVNLNIIIKGNLLDKENIEIYKVVIEDYNLNCKIYYYDEFGFDIDTYKWIANKLINKYIFFFNSKSIIMCKTGLAIYFNTIENYPNSVISATASYQSHISSVFQKNKFGFEKGKSFGYHFRKYKLFLKAFFYWQFFFKRFPSPHIRTNAFLINRELFLSLKFPKIKTKFDAYKFESGRNSLTNQILKKGLKALIVGKDGKAYDIKDWKHSNTFWQGNQQNLLVSDNQTENYKNATKEEKKHMQYLAWGKYD